METAKESMGKRIKTALSSAKKTQRELAKKLNIAESSVTAYIQGVNEPSAHGLAVIANMCGVSIDWIVTGKEQDITVTVTRNDAMREIMKAVIVGDKELLDQVRDAAAAYVGGGNSDEQIVLNLYRKLGQAEREKVIEIARLYAGEREG